MPLAPVLKRLLLLAAALLPVLLAPASASALNLRYLLPGVAERPEIVRVIASLGFTICSHSHTHADLTKLTPDEVAAPAVDTCQVM